MKKSIEYLYIGKYDCKIDFEELTSNLHKIKKIGKTTLEHIHYYVIDEAKTMLLSSNNTVQGISTILGFEYPQQFSRLFKRETGMSPIEYKQVS